MPPRLKPFWQLPPGVNRGTWDYFESTGISADYDEYFRDSQLLALDIDFVRRHLPAAGSHLDSGSRDRPIVADFGCGTGRVAEALVPLGYRVLNVDLSTNMLKEVRQREIGTDSVCLRANLAQLEGLQSNVLDLGVCLFSSIGMVQGRENRAKFLRETQRSLKPGSKLIVHVHNRLHSLRDPGGLRWLIASRLRSWRDRNSEFGDRTYRYRGLPAMYLHIFGRHEILADFRTAGFANIQLFPINSTGSELMSKRSWCVDFRAGGFFIVGEAR